MTLENSAQRAHNPDPDHATLLATLLSRDRIYQGIRHFFHDRAYAEVETPLLVPCPGIDPHIDAISAEGDLYLATSPELHMKRLVGMGMPRIFQITRAFRRGEQGGLHNPEFSMLEWYHAGKDYIYLMSEVEDLVRHLVDKLDEQGIRGITLNPPPFPRFTVDRLFEQYAGWTPSSQWDEDRFFLDLVEKVEPRLCAEPAVIIQDFPAPLASLARCKPDEPHLCERFELYMNGLEIANAFSELTDPVEQRERFEAAQERRKEMGKEVYPIDQKFLLLLEQGLLPPCCGIALGLDRLAMALLGARGIEDVMAFPAARL
ncbi:MAG: EF-P lysine aminoacylase EpmA [bacterium]